MEEPMNYIQYLIMALQQPSPLTEKLKKIIDSNYLSKTNPQDQINEQEDINCILPLFYVTDQDLQPILIQRYIKLLMTLWYSHANTLYEESYLPLLANSLTYILQDSQWKFEHLELIYSTTKIVYSGTKQFEYYLYKIINQLFWLFLEKHLEYEQFISLATTFIYALEED